MCNLNMPNQYEPNQLGILICPEQKKQKQNM